MNQQTIFNSSQKKFPLTSVNVKNATFYFYILETLSIEHSEINFSTAMCRSSMRNEVTACWSLYVTNQYVRVLQITWVQLTLLKTNEQKSNNPMFYKYRNIYFDYWGSVCTERTCVGWSKAPHSELLIPLHCLRLWYLVIQILKLVLGIQLRTRNHDSLLKPDVRY